MKKNCLKVLMLLILALSTFSILGCANNSSDKIIDLKVYLLNKPDSANADWGMWWWYDDPSGNDIPVSEDKGKWPVGADSLTELDDIGSYVVIQFDTTKGLDLGLLFVDKNSSAKSADIVVPMNDFINTKTLYCLYDNMTGYYTDISATYGLISATILNKEATQISAKAYKVSSVSNGEIVVTDCEGNKLEIESAKIKEDGSVYIVLKSGSIAKAPYSVTYNNKSVSATIDYDLIDEVYSYDGDDLGLTLVDSTASFKTWAPLASKVELLLFEDSASLTTPAKTETMTFDSTTGVWSISNVDVSSYKYYKYAITNQGTTNNIADIHSYSSSVDSTASQIVDINSDLSGAKPAGWGEYQNPWNGTSYSDAVIYEMHIRDWAKAFSKDNDGKFAEITAELGESGKFATHLKDLGITHVQILPMFEYAEKYSDKNYNWGYNPYHYNVPEGRYVDYDTNKNGTDAVFQLREMVQAFHDAGIAVIMDVVYNHTSGTQSGSLYDMTVPNYFYRQNETGGYSNGSGCGNETASNRFMYRKYMIDSLKHWMKDYHINGFRFDLMGIHEADTMKEIYEELYKIDNKVMVYGEPWAGGTTATDEGAEEAVQSDTGLGAGAFDDDFRNAIKGGEFGGFQKGHVQGIYNDKAIITGLTGAETKRNNTGNPALSLHYVECHDNYTLFDKLAISYLDKEKYSDDLFTAIKEDGLSTVKAQNKLSAAYIFLSQGTPFINGGQEFMRTKKGDENSYKSDDTINAIDLSFKDTYSDVYNVYKGLIAFRKANPDAFGANTTAVAEVYNKTAGVTKYTTGDFLVYFNATEKSVEIESTGYTKVIDITSGTPTESTTLPASVPAKSFVILKK